MYLFINNLANQKTFIGIKVKDAITWLFSNNPGNRNENILININKILEKNNIKIKSLQGIVVVNGPGSFSGIRVALAIANTLSWTLNIPAIGVSLPPYPHSSHLGAQLPSNEIRQINVDLFEKGIAKFLKTKPLKQVLPFYGKEPNITKPKKIAED
ncbi:hypothetical protein ISS06_00955 [Patescibacteria group bacterium]|nr:hypothetical protein [Patescibacteria group bacterium]